MNWLHAFYGIGALSGPLLMTSMLEAGRGWQAGYALVGAGQLVLVGCFAFSQRHWVVRDKETSDDTSARAGLLDTLHLPSVWLSVAMFFVYTGTEATAGAGAYSLFTEARGVARMTAGTWVSVYQSALTAGRIGAALLAHRLPVNQLLRGCIAGQAAGALLL